VILVQLNAAVVICYCVVYVCLSTVAKLTAAAADGGSIDEEQLSSQQLDASYGSLRELVSESLRQQEAVLERIQVSN